MRQRRLAKPAFHKSRINEYASPMIDISLAHIRGWKDGEQRDVAADMMAVTLDVAVRNAATGHFADAIYNLPRFDTENRATSSHILSDPIIFISKPNLGSSVECFRCRSTFKLRRT